MCQIHFETLGCKVNQIESESAARSFIDVGFSVDANSWTANEKQHSETILCIVNTCTVTAKAEQKARRIIRVLLTTCPNACILVTGCYAQLDEPLIKAIDKRILVLPGQQKDLLLDLSIFLKDNLQTNTTDKTFELITKFLKTNIKYSINTTTTFKLSTDTFLQHSRSSLKIQDGCNNNCAFCRIHLARGKSISLDAEKVLERVKKLELSGQSEVVLTGVNLTQYNGKLKQTTLNLSTLLRYLLDNTTKIAFRLSSLYPQSITDEFCKIIQNPRLRAHFHLSVQSGSNTILQKMGRPYTAEQVQTACTKLRQAKPECFLACDIITGFPGETNDDYLLTENLCKNCNFSWIHVFPYSARPGTEGALMKPKVPQYISGERVEKLTQIAILQKKQFVNSLIGKTFTAIIENHTSGIRRAVTENFLHVKLTNSKNLPEKPTGEILVQILSISSTKGCDADALIL